MKRVFTSAAESTLLYMRKSLKPPLISGFSHHQLLLPKKLLDLKTDLGYGLDAAELTWTPLMYTIQVREGFRVHATWFQVLLVLNLKEVYKSDRTSSITICAIIVPFVGRLAKRILSDPPSFPKSKIRAQLLLLSDLHQVAKVRPAVPVVKESMLMYWLLAAESCSWLLETAAPFSRVASYTTDPLAMLPTLDPDTDAASKR